MKKRILFLTLITAFALFAHQSALLTRAATPTPEETNSELETIEKIKDMVASRVAELDLVEKRGFLGEVSEASNTSVKIKDLQGKIKNIDIDELTEFQAAKSEEFGISDIKKGDIISFVGLYNKDTERLLARFVKKATAIPTSFEGVILEKDTEEYTLTVVNEKGEKRTVDIESSTDTYAYSKGQEEEKSGFSKIEVGERVIVTGFPSKEDSNRLSASRILVLLGIQPSEAMKKHMGNIEPKTDTEITPTTTEKE